MNNRKIILYVLLGILGIGLILFLLVYLTVIPNPFADNKTLVCTREGNFGSIEEKQIKFDWLGNFKSLMAIEYTTFDTNEQAREYYESALESFDKVLLENNVVTTKIKINTNDSFNKRKEIKDNYIEFGYECR